MDNKCSNCGQRDATHDGYCGPCAVELARQHAREMWNYPPRNDDSTYNYIPERDERDDNRID